MTTERIMAEFASHADRYNRLANKMGTLLKELIDSQGIVPHSIQSRVKSQDSLRKKLSREDKDYAALSDITDIVGARIITYMSHDIERVSQIVGREFAVDHKNSVDKRKADATTFGYASVHYVVGINTARLAMPENKFCEGLVCEIQIRTVLQHAWAEIEHDLGYKSKLQIPIRLKGGDFRDLLHCLIWLTTNSWD